MSGLRPPRTMKALTDLREFTRWCKAQEIVIPTDYLQNVSEDASPALGGNLEAGGKKIKLPQLEGYSTSRAIATVNGGALVFDYEKGNAYTVTLTANVTSISIVNAPLSSVYGKMLIRFVQDSTGSRTVSGWPSSVKWPGGTAPTITTTATTGTDVIILRTFAGSAEWLGEFTQNYS